LLRAARFFQHDQHARYDGKTSLLNITLLFVTNSRGIEVAKSIMPATGSWRHLMVQRVRFAADGQL
jgi:hypothetical protein